MFLETFPVSNGMKILSIETSCDETALSILEATGSIKKPAFKILANEVASQIELHTQYGGVFPMMAKREHSKAAIPLLKKILKDARLWSAKIKNQNVKFEIKIENKIKKILEREPELLAQFLEYIPTINIPKLDLIAVTSGPGLEPALWVGISFAKALSVAWNLPVMPVNHMEGHVVSSLLKAREKKEGKEKIQPVSFPAISLLISGGHTELVLMKDWMKYTVIGETVDDAAGEAFDKVARMMDLPYPGGPEISKLAKEGKENLNIQLPRPMIHSPNFNFSFSGLKTAVLYLIRKIGPLDAQTKKDIAREFENAVTDVLVKKTTKAIEKYKTKTLLLGGGVASNEKIKRAFKDLQKETFPKMKMYFPRKDLSTDNSLMIGMVGYFRFLKNKKGKNPASIKAQGNLKI